MNIKPYEITSFNDNLYNDLRQLYEETYGKTIGMEKRWKWEWACNPNKDDNRIYVAESDDCIAGATYRWPFELITDGRKIKTAFSVNSMVHPNFRRMGIMEKLYKKSFDDFPILFSKGTMPGMYRLLLKIGYLPLAPNTIFTSIVSPFCWMIWRIGLKKISPRIDKLSETDFSEYKLILRFDEKFDQFFTKIHKSFYGIINKNKEYMNWRYFDIPIRKYKIFNRVVDSKIVSYIVLGSAGSTGKIVDLLWDHDQKDEPRKSIRFAKRFFRKSGFIKVSCWCTYTKLRESLKKQFFFDRGETPNFSYYSKDPNFTIDDVGKYHFVDGDGDFEYL